jgi:hypothetical protein
MTKQQKLEIISFSTLLLLFIVSVGIVIYFNYWLVDSLQSISNSSSFTSEERQIINELTIVIKRGVAPVNFTLGIFVGLSATELLKQVKKLRKQDINDNHE